MIPTVGLHAGVAGTVGWAASKIEEIKLVSPQKNIDIDHKDYRIASDTETLKFLFYAG
ncbi:hypothetical protein ACF3DV_15305 [Chlorogloeopsis fritschii PCC 9212]|uniref:Uncharacterized protein n=1 Tax=Chlorogloeopsis fritschii PCC 6912 TaxID=211165 RepID=A0A3S0ZYU7_CHLFR|nr:hypothetical protein PCC6912_22830 [Chlorogloeopsis fritschii PCC 6912]